MEGAEHVVPGECATTSRSHSFIIHSFPCIIRREHPFNSSSSPLFCLLLIQADCSFNRRFGVLLLGVLWDQRINDCVAASFMDNLELLLISCILNTLYKSWTRTNKSHCLASFIVSKNLLITLLSLLM